MTDRSGLRRPGPGRSVDLPVPSPPTLLEAVGYTGEARYVALHWASYGDDLIVDDGVTSRTANWRAWLTFTQHPLMRAVLAGYELGSGDAPAAHRLLVDRSTATLSVGLAEDVAALLRSQPNALHAMTADMTAEHAAAHVREALAATAAPTMDEVLSAMQHSAGAEAAMRTWLDQLLRQVLDARGVATRVGDLADDINDRGAALSPGSHPSDTADPGAEAGAGAPDAGELDID
jgi:hypothetical protein